MVKYNQEIYTEKLREVWGDKFTVLGRYTKGREPILIKCNTCGNTWSPQASAFLRGGCGCPYCSGRHQYTPDEFRNKVNLLFKGKYTVIDNYKNEKDKLAVKCNTCGHTFMAIPNQLLRGHGCARCAGNYRGGLEGFKEKLRKMYGDRYTAIGKYTNNRTKIEVKCNICGHTWTPLPTNILRNEGCPYCSGLHHYTQKEFEKTVYYKLGNSYTIIGKYINSDTNLDVRCNTCGSIWSVKPYNLLGGKGCPVCSGSQGERFIKIYLDSTKIKYTRQKKFNDLVDKLPLSYDFFIPSINVLIEYQGRQHFEPVAHFGGDKVFNRQKRHDIMKSQYAINNGYTLLCLGYKLDTYNKVKRYLEKYID